MNLRKIVALTNLFYSLANDKTMPDNSENLKTILKNISELETYISRKEYAEKNLKHLSSGSSRIVYLTPEKTIVKMAKNDRGIAQNKAENNSGKLNSKYLNKPLDCASNYSWIEVPYLEKITTKDFKEMTGLDFDEFGDAIRYNLKSISGNTDKEKPENYDVISKNPMFKEIGAVAKELDLMPGDLARISSFGKKDNHPVLIDVGLTKNVFEEFYESTS